MHGYDTHVHDAHSLTMCTPTMHKATITVTTAGRGGQVVEMVAPEEEAGQLEEVTPVGKILATTRSPRLRRLGPQKLLVAALPVAQCGQ